MAYKIKISKPGSNVLTETNINNLIFSSDYNTLKYYSSGTYSITFNANRAGFYENTGEITHNLGYVPFFWVLNKNSYYPNNYYVIPSEVFCEAYATSTKLYLYTKIYIYEPGQVIYNYYYKIFKNNLGL